MKVAQDLIDKVFYDLEQAKKIAIANREIHITRVKNAIDWFMSCDPYFRYLERNLNDIKHSFTGTGIEYKGVTVMCVHHDFTYPNADFELIPIHAKEDIGNGDGMSIIKSF